MNLNKNQIWRKIIYNKFMQKWLNNNNHLTYSTHNEANSVVVERFLRPFEDKIYKKWQLIIANPGYLIKLVDEYSNTYHCSIGKGSVDAEYSALTKTIELSH